MADAAPFSPPFLLPERQGQRKYGLDDPRLLSVISYNPPVCTPSKDWIATIMWLGTG
jgi:hypothetical protein